MMPAFFFTFFTNQTEKTLLYEGGQTMISKDYERDLTELFSYDPGCKGRGGLKLGPKTRISFKIARVQKIAREKDKEV